MNFSKNKIVLINKQKQKSKIFTNLQKKKFKKLAKKLNNNNYCNNNNKNKIHYKF